MLEESILDKLKRKLSELSTWEGIALIAGSAGIYVNPEAGMMIVSGVLLVVGGIELWKRGRTVHEDE